MSTTKLTAENGTNTLNTIKAYIYNEGGKLDSTMISFLFDLAERAFELKGAKVAARTCGVSFVSAAITHAQRQ